METHSSILAWRLPMERGTWWLQSVGTQRVGHGWATKHIKCMCIYLIPIWHRVSTVCSVAKSCLTVCNPIDGSPPDSSIPGIFQANGVGCHLLLQCITGIGYMYHWHSICINNTYSNTEFPGGPMAKNLPVNVGNTGSIPALGRFHMPQSNYACMPQLLRLCSRVWAPQGEKPMDHNKVQPSLVAARESLRAAVKTQCNHK